MKKTIYTMWKRCEENYSELPAVRWLIKKNIQERSYGELAAAVSAIKKSARPGDIVLLKGSRGMEMERITALLEGKA